jgi:thymidylate synthase
MELLKTQGLERESRNGKVLVMDGPVTTHYHRPQERVVFQNWRDANPFFHFFEGLWMIAGRNDVHSVSQFAPMSRFSDDGVTLHGAYGKRWRSWFHLPQETGTRDQLAVIAKRLRENKDDRRCVLQMWDADTDLDRDGRDVPCNTQVYLGVSVEGSLDMTVCCRSNDMIWGAYGANAVHFSMMQEFMAAWTGIPIGHYWQISNNFHAYQNVFAKHDELRPPLEQESDLYELGHVSPYPMVSTPVEQWMEDLLMMLDEGVVVGLRDPFFRRVAVPIIMAHRHFKTTQGVDRYDGALEILRQCAAPDWAIACADWIVRRRVRFERAQDGGAHANEE